MVEYHHASRESSQQTENGEIFFFPTKSNLLKAQPFQLNPKKTPLKHHKSSLYQLILKETWSEKRSMARKSFTMNQLVLEKSLYCR